MRRVARRAATALGVALALPALAYILPVHAILERMGQRRASLSLTSLAVTGTLSAEGEEAGPLAALARLPAPSGRVSVPASFRMKVPGRCRLDIEPLDVPEAERPYVAVRDGRVAGSGGLERLSAAVALVHSTCTLLATRAPGETGGYAAALGRRGVALTEASLGRFDGQIAYVVGGHARDARPLLFVQKDGFQPLRLVTAEADGLQDVRLLGWGSPTGGDWFPRVVEAWRGGAPRLRFTTERATANPRLPEPLFP